MKPNLSEKLNLRLILTPVFLVIIVLQAGGMIVTGNVTAQQGSSEEAVVHSIMDGRRLDIHQVDKYGKYTLELACNHKYELIFAMKGNFSQKIIVETLVPDNILKFAPQFAPIALNVNLFSEISGIKISFTHKPTRKIYYNPLVNDFVTDIYSDDNQIARQIEKAVFQSKILNKEIDFISKLTPFELAKLKREYTRIIENAGKFYNETPVLAALDDNLKPNDFDADDLFSITDNDMLNELLRTIVLAAESDKNQTEKYDDFIREADEFFNQEKYLKARISYKRALSVNPDDFYAKSQSNLIDDFLEEQLVSEQYKNLIAYADNSFNELLYSEAAKNYRSALLVKPAEEYPKNRLEKINTILGKEYQNAGKTTNYRQTMKEGEAMYHKQFYEKSLASYNNALNLQPGDNSAIMRIADIKQEMNRLADKLMFDKLIASADKLYRKEHYPEAMKEYFAATELIPNNNYALIRINAIDKKLMLEEKFQDFIADANYQFAAHEYSQARENYLQALKIKANDNYAENRIKEIDKIIQIQNTEEKYYTSIAEADEMIKNNDFSNAINKYDEALKIKPDEKYPVEKLRELNTALTQSHKNDYPETNDSFKQNTGANLKVADNDVRQAEQQKTNHPVNFEKNDDSMVSSTFLNRNSEPENLKVSEIPVTSDATHILNANGENEIESYDTRKEAEDFSGKELENVELKNDEELETMYAQYIVKADELFDTKKYIESRSWYFKAWDIDPEENHSKIRIDKINQLLREIPVSPIDKEYLHFVNLADSTFRENQFVVARGWYNRALTAKSYEQYPKDQLNEIEIKIAERMAAQSGQQFETDVQKATAAFEAKNYNVARFWYKKALELRPDDASVKARLYEIEAALK